MSEPRKFLVSGGSGGIGGALCLALAEAGFRPIVGYSTNEVAAVELAHRCGSIAVPLDLGDEEAVAAAVEYLATENMGGALAGVILAASPPPSLVPFTRIDSASLARQWQINVAGPQQLLAGLIKRCLSRQKAGVVVGVLTRALGIERPLVEGNVVQPAAARGMGAYVIAKFGLAGLLATTAAEYPWLRVRAVSPGYTRTPMLDAFDERFLKMQARSQPIRTPEEVAFEILQEIVGS